MKNRGRILVTGGAGYIGSHTVRKLKEAGYDVLIYDNFSSGHYDAIKGFDFVEGGLEDLDKLDKVFKDNQIEAVIHFAGIIEAGESNSDPKRFFQSNFVNSLNLADIMVANRVKKIVFSSTAAVYGEPEKIPVGETDKKEPTNTYGLSKLMFEQVLEAYDKAYGLKSVALRYFNAAGADSSGEIGADHKHKTHLITLLMLAALGKRDSLEIFGTDYPTEDGTCIRDYVHVSDLADAHVLALKYIEADKPSDKFNLGSEKGSSVREIITATRKITGKDIRVREKKKRSGDPAVLVADIKKAEIILGWVPKHSSIDEIISTAWNWHSQHPEGFGS